MAKKQLTPEEYKAKLEKKATKRKNFSEIFFKAVGLFLAVVMTFCIVVVANVRLNTVGTGAAVNTSGNANSNESVDSNTNNDSSVDFDENSNSSGSNTTVDDGSNNASDNSNSNNTSDNSGTTSGGNTTGNNSAEKPSTGSTASDQEILDMYKKAVANARTNSTSVVRVKDGAINYKGIVEAGGLSSAASTLMGAFMAKDENAIEVKNEPWEKEQLPDASALTLNGIKEIKRADQGDTYLIRVIAKDVTNPKANADGVGSIAGVIEESQITGAIGVVPGLSLSNINIAYENVTAIATIDKATGNLIALNLNAPCVLGLDAKLAFPPISMEGAKVGIQIITEYKISY